MSGFEKKSWEISLFVDNLFDDQYASEVTKDTTGDKNYIPAAPRSLMVKCILNF